MSTNIENILKKHFPNAEISLLGEGCALKLRIVSEDFLNLSRLKRQQSVYAVLGPFIQSGEIHALTIETYTIEEWSQKTKGA